MNKYSTVPNKRAPPLIKIEHCKTYLSIRNSIKSDEIDFSECFRFQRYF